MTQRKVQEMYEQYARPAYGYLLSLCKNPAVAEDLTAETFYRAVKSSGRYNASCKLHTETRIALTQPPSRRTPRGK